MNTQPSVNYERFPSEYFSGSDIRVYFEDTLIDEITELQFALEERILPIYGYNSFMYDAVARGTRIVQGTFALNFKSADYLRSAVNEIINNKDSEFDVNKNYIATEKDVNAGYYDFEANKDRLHGFLEKGWSTKFDEMANEYEERIWGGVQENINSATSNKPYFQSDADTDRTFDIMITYGPYKKDRMYAQDDYGREQEIKYHQNVNNGTIKSINNIQITGLTQVLNGSGEPIKEVYNFLARDLDRV